MTEIEIERLAELSEKATKGEWRDANEKGSDDPYILVAGHTGFHSLPIISGLWPTHEDTPEAAKKAEDDTYSNTAFIAALVNWFRANLPALRGEPYEPTPDEVMAASHTADSPEPSNAAPQAGQELSPSAIVASAAGPAVAAPDVAAMVKRLRTLYH